MLRRASRSRLPTRSNWHGLQNFAVQDAHAVAFRDARAADAQVAGVISSAEKAEKIDWPQWKSSIAHSEVVDSLQNFHQSQKQLLDTFAKADHAAALTSQTAGWDLFDSAVKSCSKSVEASERIVSNGARALFISYNNPPINLASQTEWIDSDQYWAAFVEKHHFYHNHLNFSIEDPESKEYDLKQDNDIRAKWKKFDGKGQVRLNNKLLYQRPSHEYYNLFRGVFIEHMCFYLAKTGGDANFFPQCMPHQWFSEIYDQKKNVLSVLQRRKRIEQERHSSREVFHDLIPHDLEHGADAYYMQMAARQNALVELQVGRLMGNFIFLSEAIPVQTQSGLLKAQALDGGKGTFYSLGSDVNALFYKPAEAVSSSPMDGLNSHLDHLNLTGRRMPVGEAEVLSVFHNVLESRKSGLGGAWFNVDGETQAQAFMRRLQKTNAAYGIYEAYVEELAERWGKAEVVAADKVEAALKEVSAKYAVECDAFGVIAMNVCEELLTASRDNTVPQLLESGEMAGLLDGGAYVAVDATGALSAEQLAEKVASFEDTASKAQDAVLNRKAAYDKQLA